MDTILAQIRECYGRIVYSHKTHEKCADIYFKRLRRMKTASVIFSAIAASGIVYAILGHNDASGYFAAIFSFLNLALNLYTKDLDLGGLSQKHKETADKLWEVRENYLSLITDIRSSAISQDRILERRDELQSLASSIYSVAPRTLDKAYALAQKALQINEELTFSEREIDLLLPEFLRNK